jgi:hypothetical protein
MPKVSGSPITIPQSRSTVALITVVAGMIPEQGRRSSGKGGIDPSPSCV